jgi:Protein of unknown function (DUF1559)
MPTASFKIPCPSCEAGVLVKDESMIGKKIDCPKCKYRFVVEKPNSKESAAPAKKPAAAPAKAKGAPPAKTAAKTKPGAKPPAPAEAETKEEGKKKKKTNKMMLPLALGGVGVLVLVVGAYLLFFSGKKSPNKAPVKPGPRLDLVQNAGKDGSADDEGKSPRPGGKKGTKPKTDTKDKSEKEKTQEAVKPTVPVVPAVPVAAAGPELTNLLPAEPQHITHVFVKDAIDGIPMLVNAVFQPGAINDEDFTKRIGFHLHLVDDVIRAENYTAPWAFTVVHLKEAVDPEALREALGLEPAAGSPMNGRDFFKITKNRPWLDQLGRLTLGTMPPPQTGKGEDRPLFVRIHDPGTLVFGDATPMQEYLARGTAATGTAYATLKNLTFKNMLNKLEKNHPASDRVIISSVTDLEAARLPGAAPGRVEWRYRPIWDVAHSLPQNPQRLRLIGTVLLRKGRREPLIYHYLNEIECVSDGDAHTVREEVAEKVAPVVAGNLELLLGVKVVVAPYGIIEPGPNSPTATSSPPPSGPPGGSRPGGRPGGYIGMRRPPPTNLPKKEPTMVLPSTSYITMADKDKSVTCTLHLVLEEKPLARLAAFTDLLMVGISGQLEAAAGKSHRNDLARAEKLLGEQGIKKWVPAGQYPPGLFPRKTAKVRSASDPDQRISWMAGLLPYLGRDALYTRINFDLSWKDPSNWMAARAVVPEFLDLTYPVGATVAHNPAVPFPLGATHFVGIAGIGQDAPDYAPDDPTVANKLGVFGYDRQTSLDEIKKNRGLSRTAVMVQVPHDGPAGVTPWMAGGGSTIRGVPETDSVRPFVSTTQDGKRGTFVLMADGSVRFVTADVRDEVFKAMCTIKGPAEVAGAK